MSWEKLIGSLHQVSLQPCMAHVPPRARLWHLCAEVSWGQMSGISYSRSIQGCRDIRFRWAAILCNCSTESMTAGSNFLPRVFVATISGRATNINLQRMVVCIGIEDAYMTDQSGKE